MKYCFVYLEIYRFANKWGILDLKYVQSEERYVGKKKKNSNEMGKLCYSREHKP